MTQIDFGFDDMEFELSESAKQLALTFYNKEYLGGMSGAMQRKVIEKVGEKMDERDKQITTTLDSTTKYVENTSALAERVRDSIDRPDMAKSSNAHFLKALNVFRAGGKDVVVFNKSLSSGKAKAAIILSDEIVKDEENETSCNIAKLFVDIVRKITKGDHKNGPLRKRSNQLLERLADKEYSVKKFIKKTGKDRFVKDEKGDHVLDKDGNKILQKHAREMPEYKDNVYEADDFDKSKHVTKHGDTVEKEIDGEIYYVTTQQRWKVVPGKFEDEATEEIKDLAEVYFNTVTAWARSLSPEDKEKFISRNKTAQGNPLGTMAGGKKGMRTKNQEAVLQYYVKFFANAPELEDIAMEINRAMQQNIAAKSATEQLGTCTESFETIGNSSTIMKAGIDGVVKKIAKQEAIQHQSRVERQASLRSRKRTNSSSSPSPKKQFRGKDAAVLERMKELSAEEEEAEL